MPHHVKASLNRAAQNWRDELDDLYDDYDDDEPHDDDLYYDQQPDAHQHTHTHTQDDQPNHTHTPTATHKHHTHTQHHLQPLEPQAHALDVDAEALANLQYMGFTSQAATRALLAHDNALDAALDELLSHPSTASPPNSAPPPCPLAAAAAAAAAATAAAPRASTSALKPRAGAAAPTAARIPTGEQRERSKQRLVAQPPGLLRPAADSPSKPRVAAAASFTSRREATGAPSISAAIPSSDPFTAAHSAPPAPSTQLNLVVVGHVDAGKSTLVGRLLESTGRVDARSLHRCAREADALGKPSFAYAFLLDHAPEERERGVTIEASSAFFEADGREINILDAPGHRDFVPAMVGAAAQADAVLLVLNASPGELEAGFAGQTLEHLRVARCLGSSALLVAVNQMDAVGYARKGFDEVVAASRSVLVRAGYDPGTTRFVPVSALHGAGLTDASSPPGLGWYDGPPLLAAVGALEPRPRPFTVGARLCINDVILGGHGGIAVAGTLQAGELRVSQRLRLMPADEELQVRSVRSRDKAVQQAVAGDHVEVGLSIVGSMSATELRIAAGSVLCDLASPARVARVLEVALRTLEPATPLTRGFPCELYVHAASCGASISSIVCALGPRSERLEGAPRPRVLGPNCAALVRLKLERPVCVDVHTDCKPTGRLVLREGGRTVAAGVISAVIK